MTRCRECLGAGGISMRLLAHFRLMSGLYDNYDTLAHPDRRSAALAPVFLIHTRYPTLKYRNSK